MLLNFLGLGVALASSEAQVALIDPSHKYFKENEDPKTVTEVDGAVCGSFYLSKLDPAAPSLNQYPLSTPLMNLQLTLYGLTDPKEFDELNEFTFTPLTSGVNAGLASTLLLKSLMEDLPEAKIYSRSSNARTASTYDFQHKARVLTTSVGDDVEAALRQVKGSDRLVSAEGQEFLREMSLFIDASRHFAAASKASPQFHFLTMESFSALPTDSEKAAAKAVLSYVFETLFKALPQDSVAEVIFSENKNTLYKEMFVNERRRRLEDATNSSNSSGITYTEMHETQIMYWFSVGAVLVLYFFSYCFATMSYMEGDSTLNTAFDASWDDKKRK